MKISINLSKHFLFIAVAVAVIAVTGLYIWNRTPQISPVPDSIKQQLNYSVLYPTGYTIDPSSWTYLKAQQTVSFNVKLGGNSILFTEEKVPLAYSGDAAAYNRFIGSLKPIANFNVPLGTVSLANFITDDLRPVGATGILKAKGTFLLVHPSQNLSNNDWRQLFESLKVDK
jgi:hypothetical protein